MKKKNVLVCLDRDGTIEYDNRFHLGSKRNWKSKVRLLSHVVEGLKKLGKIDGVKVYIITNQRGVAIKDFPKLTLHRAEEVSRYIIERLEKKGAHIDGYEVCGHAGSDYVKERPEFKFDKKLVCDDCNCLKPKPGMVNKILKREGWNKKNTNIYVLGDRKTDVQTGINAGGVGILIPFSNRKDEVMKVREIKSRKKYVAKDFMGAVRFIKEREK